jgi:hypothetical protein
MVRRPNLFKSLTFASHVIVFPFKSKDKLCLFVLGPMANYCPVTWHFCSEKNTKKLKKFRKELSVSFMKTMKILMKIYLKNLNCHL